MSYFYQRDNRAPRDHVLAPNYWANTSCGCGENYTCVMELPCSFARAYARQWHTYFVTSRPQQWNMLSTPLLVTIGRHAEVAWEDMRRFQEEFPSSPFIEQEMAQQISRQTYAMFVARAQNAEYPICVYRLDRWYTIANRYVHVQPQYQHPARPANWRQQHRGREQRQAIPAERGRRYVVDEDSDEDAREMELVLARRERAQNQEARQVMLVSDDEDHHHGPREGDQDSNESEEEHAQEDDIPIIDIEQEEEDEFNRRNFEREMNRMRDDMMREVQRAVQDYRRL